MCLCRLSRCRRNTHRNTNTNTLEFWSQDLNNANEVTRKCLFETNTKRKLKLKFNRWFVHHFMYLLSLMKSIQTVCTMHMNKHLLSYFTLQCIDERTIHYPQRQWIGRCNGTKRHSSSCRSSHKQTESQLFKLSAKTFDRCTLRRDVKTATNTKSKMGRSWGLKLWGCSTRPEYQPTERCWEVAQSVQWLK